ncbi:MAG TPA: hypothetical protein PKD78_15220, partial [Saprospiraceae bacterium]|nr:hypothetical protein [Saprospiraceae bacterium]
LRAMLSDFKKIAVFPLHLADLTLYWVELAVEYIIHNHYVKDTFFAPTEKVMDEAADLICDHTLQSYFQARLEALRDQVGKLRYYDGFKHSIVATIGFMLGDE